MYILYVNAIITTYLDTDCPTMQQLSVFVLSQSDVVQEWSRLHSLLDQNARTRISVYGNNPPPVDCCALVLENWLTTPAPTWSFLLSVIERINPSAADRIANFLPGIVTIPHNFMYVYYVD